MGKKVLEKLTKKELEEVVKRNVDYLIRDIDNVLWNMRQNVFNQIKYYELNYKEEVFRTIVNLIIEEVVIHLIKKKEIVKSELGVN